jgi:NAD+ diphosphatase
VTLDRSTHRRTDPAWIAEAWTKAKVIVVDVAHTAVGRALVRDDELVLFDSTDLAVASSDPRDRYFLGVDADDTPYFAVAGELPAIAGTRAVTLRDVGHTLDRVAADIMLTAIAIAYWHRRHPYSPANGVPTIVGEAGWIRADPDGGQYWPRTDPAVIMLVHDGGSGPDGRCLLGNNAAWVPQPGRPRGFSCLAGFVEPGETLEAAVAREVFEEVGIRVHDVRYVASQPWPFPSSLMLGFTAIGDPADPIRLDPKEIADARWFTRAEIAAVLAIDPDERVDEPGLPTPASIAYRLVREWALP